MSLKDDLFEYKVCCLVGVPSDALWEERLNWVNKEKFHRLLIISPYPDLMEKFSRERVSFYWAHATKSLVYMQIAHQYLHTPLDIIPITEQDKAACMALEEACLEMNAWAGQFKEKGLDLLRNTLQNVRLSDQFLDATALERPFSGVPAVICGAGPSLDISLLRKIQQKGLVFAGGATVGILLQNGIKPHFAGMIDGDPEQISIQGFDRGDFPLFFQMRCSPSCLRKHAGSKLWWPSSDALPLENSVAAHLRGLEVPAFDGGWTVSTFLISVARTLGCSLITTMGCDHVMQGGRKYIHGAESGESFAKEEDVEPLEWSCARHWLKKAPLVPLESVLDYPSKDYTSIVEGFLVQLPKLNQRYENTEILVEKILDSFSVVEKKIWEMLNILESFYPRFSQESDVYQSCKISLEKEWAYQDFFMNVWRVWESYFARLVCHDGVDQELGLELHKYLFFRDLCQEISTLRKLKGVKCSGDPVF